VQGERIFLGLGSNLGDREQNIRSALARIAALPETRVVAVSSVLETEPWGVRDQPSFLNAAAEIRSSLPPAQLLSAIKQIESDLGRTPTFRWGPRVIDIDLLLYGERRVHEVNLRLPHPHILERPFVWEPLAEIAPEVVEELRRAAVSL
jgi:2-amino-4-hydroxy-6-hydroxymethyldihydropteridine diphosphokinase